MGKRRIVITMASLALLVLVLGVVGASADGVMGGHSHANLVSFDAIHNFSGAAAWHNDFAPAGRTHFEGIENGYWFGTALFGAPVAAIVPTPPPPPSTTPEPGTLYLLLMGGGLLVLGVRRRATQS